MQTCARIRRPSRFYGRTELSECPEPVRRGTQGATSGLRPRFAAKPWTNERAWANRVQPSNSKRRNWWQFPALQLILQSTQGVNHENAKASVRGDPAFPGGVCGRLAAVARTAAERGFFRNRAA